MTDTLAIKTKASKLYHQRQKLAAEQFNWNSSQERKRLIAQARALAKKIPIDVTETENQDLVHAMMYLDALAIREGVFLAYGEKRSK